MADIKTHLRELSVGVWFYQKNCTVNDIKPSDFLATAQSYIEGTKSLLLHQIALSESSFNREEKEIIANGFRLSRKIASLRSFNIGAKPKISWSGFDTQSGSTIDLIIDNYKFSLKEQSMILENMGLYKLFNNLSGKELYQRGGLHCFEDFVPKKLNNWYTCTRDEMIKILKQDDYLFLSSYSSKASLESDTLTLEWTKGAKTKTSVLSNFSRTTYDDFKRATNSVTRGKVFSKLIADKIRSNPNYTKAKKECATSAANSIIASLSQYIGTSPHTLFKMFRIEEETYYYAKSTGKILEVYKVPPKNKFGSFITIDNIVSATKDTQVNIETTIKNKQTEQTFTFQNQVRYSHGQFNGSPEAKLYIKEGSLDIAYTKLL